MNQNIPNTTQENNQGIFLNNFDSQSNMNAQEELNKTSDSIIQYTLFFKLKKLRLRLCQRFFKCYQKCKHVLKKYQNLIYDFGFWILTYSESIDFFEVFKKIKEAQNFIEDLQLYIHYFGYYIQKSKIVRTKLQNIPNFKNATPYQMGCAIVTYCTWQITDNKAKQLSVKSFTVIGELIKQIINQLKPIIQGLIHYAYQKNSGNGQKNKQFTSQINHEKMVDENTSIQNKELRKLLHKNIVLFLSQVIQASRFQTAYQLQFIPFSIVICAIMRTFNINIHHQISQKITSLFMKKLNGSKKDKKNFEVFVQKLIRFQDKFQLLQTMI